MNTRTIIFILLFLPTSLFPQYCTQLYSGDDTSQGNSTDDNTRKEGINNTGFYDWLSNKSYMGGSGLENIFVGNESINVLM